MSDPKRVSVSRFVLRSRKPASGSDSVGATTKMPLPAIGTMLILQWECDYCKRYGMTHFKFGSRGQLDH